MNKKLGLTNLACSLVNHKSLFVRVTGEYEVLGSIPRSGSIGCSWDSGFVPNILQQL